jgi:hypothetical protein
MSLKTEEQKYLDWYNESKEKSNLIDVKFFPANTQTISKEDFYQEANKINDYLDNGKYTPIMKVSF